jgi:predicted amidohydrolase
MYICVCGYQDRGVRSNVWLDTHTHIYMTTRSTGLVQAHTHIYMTTRSSGLAQIIQIYTSLLTPLA